MNKAKNGNETCEEDEDKPEVNAIAHNNRGYDIYFVLQYMIQNGIKPANVITGGNILVTC